MNKPVSILLFLHLCFSSFAQVNVDSLWSVWNDQSLADTSRLKAIDDLTFKHYLMVDLDSSLILAQQMLELATDKDLKKYKADAFHNLAAIVNNKGNVSESLEFNNRSLEIRKVIGDKKGMGRSLANIGAIVQTQGDLATAINHYNKALLYFEEIGDTDLIAHILNSIASIYGTTNNYPTAIEYLSRSMEALEGTDNGYFMANTLTSLAMCYSTIDDLANAKVYAKRARTVAHKYNSTLSESNALIILASILIEESNYDGAMALYEEILLLNEKANNLYVTIGTYGSMANIFQLKGDYEQALEYYEKSLKLAESVDKKIDIISSKISIGEIYLDKRDFRKAINWCEEGLLIAKEIGNPDSQLGACECLYEAHKFLKNGNEALKYHELLLELTIGLKKDETSKNLQQMEFQKQVLADSIAAAEETRLVQEAHNEELQKKNQTRNIIAGAGLFALLLAGGFFSRWRYVRKSKAIIEEEKDRSNNLLLNILPADIAEELKIHGKAEARDFDQVSILFTDFKGFTNMSEKLSAKDLVAEINTCFEAFDGICDKYGVEKIKTIGDSYMAAGGLPVPKEDSVKNTVLAALEMAAFIVNRKREREATDQIPFEMRTGIHTGNVVAGIVGVKKFQYDVWGDTVNTASRMESNGEVGQVNISQSTYELLKNDPDFVLESRGKILAKGKGEIEMYFVHLS